MSFQCQFGVKESRIEKIKNTLQVAWQLFGGNVTQSLKNEFSTNVKIRM